MDRYIHTFYSDCKCWFSGEFKTEIARQEALRRWQLSWKDAGVIRVETSNLILVYQRPYLSKGTVLDLDEEERGNSSYGDLLRTEEVYEEPLPHAALYYQLCIQWNPNDRGPAAYWLRPTFTSQEERQTFVEWLGKRGILTFGGAAHKAYKVWLDDRTIIYDNRFTFRRSRLTSIDPVVKHCNKLLRPDIDLAVKESTC